MSDEPERDPEEIEETEFDPKKIKSPLLIDLIEPEDEIVDPLLEVDILLAEEGEEDEDEGYVWDGAEEE